MEASATSYYRVEDPVQNLKMRIRLRVLAGSDDKEDNKDAGAAKAAHEVAVSVGWQEKRFGPVELNTYLTEKREEKSPGMSTLRAGWRVLAGREAPVLSPHARKMLSACDGTDNGACAAPRPTPAPPALTPSPAARRRQEPAVRHRVGQGRGARVHVRGPRRARD